MLVLYTFFRCGKVPPMYAPWLACWRSHVVKMKILTPSFFSVSSLSPHPPRLPLCFSLPFSLVLLLLLLLLLSLLLVVLQMIEPVADQLSIPRSNIFANRLLFDDASPTGVYAGFDAEEPTSRDEGKPKVVGL